MPVRERDAGEREATDGCAVSSPDGPAPCQKHHGAGQSNKRARAVRRRASIRARRAQRTRVALAPEMLLICPVVGGSGGWLRSPAHRRSAGKVLQKRARRGRARIHAQWLRVERLCAHHWSLASQRGQVLVVVRGCVRSAPRRARSPSHRSVPAERSTTRHLSAWRCVSVRWRMGCARKARAAARGARTWDGEKV